MRFRDRIVNAYKALFGKDEIKERVLRPTDEVVIKQDLNGIEMKIKPMQENTKVSMPEPKPDVPQEIGSAMLIRCEDGKYRELKEIKPITMKVYGEDGEYRELTEEEVNEVFYEELSKIEKEKALKKARNHKYYIKNKERIKKQQKKYRDRIKKRKIATQRHREYVEKNREHINEYRRNYYKANKEHLKQYAKEYYKANKAKGAK